MSKRDPNNLTLDEYQASHIIFQYYNDYPAFQKFVSRLDEEGVDQNFIDNTFQKILRWAVSDEGAVQYAQHIGRVALHDYEELELRSGKIALKIQDLNGEEYEKEFSLKQAAQIVDLVRHYPTEYHNLFRRLGYGEDLIREMEAWFSKWPFSALGCRVYGDYISRSAGRPVQSRITRGLNDLNSELRGNKIALKINAFNGEKYVKEFSLKQAAQIADIVRHYPAEYQKLFKHLGYRDDTIKQMGAWFSKWSSSEAGHVPYTTYISQAVLQPVRSRIAQSLRELNTQEMRALDADFSPSATADWSAPRVVPLTKSNFENYNLHARPASVNVENWARKIPIVPEEENVERFTNHRGSEVSGGNWGTGNLDENSDTVRNVQQPKKTVAWETTRSPANSQESEVNGGNQLVSQDQDPASHIPSAANTKRPGFIARCRRLLSSCFNSRVSPE